MLLSRISVAGHCKTWRCHIGESASTNDEASLEAQKGRLATGMLWNYYVNPRDELGEIPMIKLTLTVLPHLSQRGFDK